MCHANPQQLVTDNSDLRRRLNEAYSLMTSQMSAVEKEWIAKYQGTEEDVRTLKDMGVSLKAKVTKHVDGLQLEAIGIVEKDDTERIKKTKSFHTQASKRKSTVGAIVDRVRSANKTIKDAQKATSANISIAMDVDVSSTTASSSSVTSSWFFSGKK